MRMKVSKCSLYCVCYHCTRVRCPYGKYGDYFGRPLPPACGICLQLYQPPRLSCDFFQSKHFHKVYKIRKKSHVLKQYDLLLMIAKAQGIDLSKYKYYLEKR